MNTNTINSIYNERANTDKNLVEIGGKVVNKYSPNKNVTFLTIVSIDGLKPNAIQVVCLEENNCRAKEHINEGDFVLVYGKIQSFLRENGTKKYNIISDVIITEDEYKDEFYCTPINKNCMFVNGEIRGVRISDEHNYTSLLIRTFTNGNISIFPVVFYNTECPDVKVGDRVSVWGNIQHKKKIDESGVTKHYTDYIAFRIEKELITELALSA